MCCADGRMPARGRPVRARLGDDGLAALRVLLLHFRRAKMHPAQVPAAAARMRATLRATLLLPRRLQLHSWVSAHTQAECALFLVYGGSGRGDVHLEMARKCINIFWEPIVSSASWIAYDSDWRFQNVFLIMLLDGLNRTFLRNRPKWE